MADWGTFARVAQLDRSFVYLSVCLIRRLFNWRWLLDGRALGRATFSATNQWESLAFARALTSRQAQRADAMLTYVISKWTTTNVATQSQATKWHGTFSKKKFERFLCLFFSIFLSLSLSLSLVDNTYISLFFLSFLIMLTDKLRFFLFSYVTSWYRLSLSFSPCANSSF